MFLCRPIWEQPLSRNRSTEWIVAEGKCLERKGTDSIFTLTCLKEEFIFLEWWSKQVRLTASPEESEHPE